MSVIETCTVRRHRVTSNQYPDFSFIRHTSIQNDPVLVCIRAFPLLASTHERNQDRVGRARGRYTPVPLRILMKAIASIQCV